LEAIGNDCGAFTGTDSGSGNARRVLAIRKKTEATVNAEGGQRQRNGGRARSANLSEKALGCRCKASIPQVRIPKQRMRPAEAQLTRVTHHSGTGISSASWRGRGGGRNEKGAVCRLLSGKRMKLERGRSLNKHTDRSIPLKDRGENRYAKEAGEANLGD